MAYSLREHQTKNYKVLSDGLHLPRWRWPKADPKLYPVEILEEDKENKLVKVHYVGYGDEHDEWIREEDAVDLEPSPQGSLGYWYHTIIHWYYHTPTFQSLLFLSYI